MKIIGEEKALIDRDFFRREFINKVLVFVTLAITVVFAASVSGIVFAHSYNERILEQQLGQVVTEEKIENTIEDIEETKENILPLPIYSENAKNRMRDIYLPDEEGKVAYLTFDDGPSTNITPQVLDILKSEDIKATFFVLGSRVELYPELVKRAYEEGHYIANHGYSHDYNNVYSSPEALFEEYTHTEKAIKWAIGNEKYSSYLFRFPGGSEGGKYAEAKNACKGILEENNVFYINWNSLTNDSVGNPSYDSIINDLKSTSEGKDKIVVLMHDSATKQLTVDTLLQIISYLREQGYSFKNFYDIMCE